MAEPPATLPLTPTRLAICGFQTRNENESFKAAAVTTILIGVIVVFVVGVLSIFRKEIRNWSRVHSANNWVFYFGLRVFGIGGLLRLCVFVSDVLGSQKNLDGFVTGFFLFSYLHVVCITKLLKIQDEVCLSDSLMAMSLLICARLDSEETVGRSIISYISAYLLLCFRYSTTPYEKGLSATTTLEQVEANTLQPTEDSQRLVLQTGQERSSSITELPTIRMEEFKRDPSIEQALREHWRENPPSDLCIEELDSLLGDYQRLVTQKYEAQSSSTSADTGIILGKTTYTFLLIKSASQLTVSDSEKLMVQYKTLVAANPTIPEDQNTAGNIDQMGKKKSHRDPPEITESERVVSVPSESEDSEFVELGSRLTGDKQKGAEALRQHWKNSYTYDLRIEELGSLLRDYQRLVIRKYEAQSSSTSADIGIIPGRETYKFRLIKSASQLRLSDIFELLFQYKTLLPSSAMKAAF